MKPSIRYTILVISLLCLAMVIGGIVSIIKMLPSPQSIARVLKRPARPGSVETLSQTRPPVIEQNPESQNRIQVEEQDDHIKENLTTPQAHSDEKMKLSLDGIKKFLNESPDDIRVCENLGRSPIFEKTKEGNKDLGYEMFFEDNERRDSIAESYRLPVRSVFQNEYLRELMREIMSYENAPNKNAEAENLMNKVGFYARATRAAAEVYENKEKYEYIANRAAHLGVIARVAMLRPSQANNSDVLKFCEDLENSIKSNQKVDIREERKEVLKLIREAGLTLKELDFNPESYVKLKTEISKNGLNFSLTGSNP
jgi:hypothetical protein